MTSRPGSRLRAALERAALDAPRARPFRPRALDAEGRPVALGERPAPAAAPARGAGAEVLARLRRHGASREVQEQVAAALARPDPEGRHPIDRAALALGSLFEVARAPRGRGTTRVLPFVGATGVGKTTGLAKLGAALVRAGRRVAFATLDGRRVGAVEQLRAYAGLLHAPLFVLRRASDLDQRGLLAPGVDAVLLDTTGDPAADVAQLAEASERLAQRPASEGSAPSLAPYLVLPAGGSAEAHERVLAACAGLAPAGCVLTKLDETRRPGAVLEVVRAAGLPVAFLGDSPDLARPLRRAGPEAFADLLLRGRLA